MDFASIFIRTFSFKKCVNNPGYIFPFPCFLAYSSTGEISK